MSFGITDAGFVRKTLPEIKASLEAAFIEKFGAGTNVSANSINGKVIGIIANELAEVWELAEDDYNAISPDTASGVSLDNSVALTAIARKQATYSTVWEILQLAAATTVNAGSRVAVAGSSPSVVFALDANVSTPLATATYGAWMSIGSLVTGDTYRVTVNATAHNHVALITDTKVDVLTALQGLINAGAEAANVTAYVDETNELLYLYADPTGDDVPDTFIIAVAVVGTGTMAIDYLGGVGAFTAEETGSTVVYAGTLTEILDSTVGWEGANNIIDATPGDDEETDAELRLRREQSLHVANGSTVEAIRTALLAVDDVDEALVRENITDVIDIENIPPHAIHCIIDTPVDPTGEKDEELAQLIWETKPAGIATYGDTTETITDSQGFPHDIKFSRPASIGILMRITYHKYDEETFPAGGEDEMKTVAAAWAVLNQLIGMDVLPQRYMGPIFDGVEGIEYMTIEVDFKAAPAGWVTTPLSIEWDERASLDSSDITIVEIP